MSFIHLSGYPLSISSFILLSPYPFLSLSLSRTVRLCYLCPALRGAQSLCHWGWRPSASLRLPASWSTSMGEALWPRRPSRMRWDGNHQQIWLSLSNSNWKSNGEWEGISTFFCMQLVPFWYDKLIAKKVYHVVFWLISVCDNILSIWDIYNGTFGLNASDIMCNLAPTVHIQDLFSRFELVSSKQSSSSGQPLIPSILQLLAVFSQTNCNWTPAN